LQDNTVRKILPDGTESYLFSTKRYGKLSYIDATSPLKILLFYRDAATVLHLDNTLSETGIYYLQKVRTSLPKRLMIKRIILVWIAVCVAPEIFPQSGQIDDSLAIARIKEKILAWANYSQTGPTIRQSVESDDLSDVYLKEQWLETFYNGSLKSGLTQDQLEDLLAGVSTFPGTSAGEFLTDLAGQSEETLSATLKSLDPEKKKLKTPEQIISFLLEGEYNRESIFKAIANLIVYKDIPADQITQQVDPEKDIPFSLLIIMGGIALLVFLIWLKRRSGKKK
jgi:hypothetical protein